MGEPAAMKLPHGASSSDVASSRHEKDLENGSSTQGDAQSINGEPPETDPEKQNRTAGPPETEDSNIVVWEDGDKENPYTWPLSRKWLMTILLVMGVLSVNIGTSVLSGSGDAIGEEYHQSREITVLITTCFLLVSPLDTIVEVM